MKRPPGDIIHQLVWLFAVATTLVLSSALGAAATGQEHEEHPASEEGAGTHEEHDFHRHHVSVFLGVTDGEIEKEHGHGEGETVDKRNFSMGLDYGYHFNQRWGVGALVEYEGQDFRTWVAGVAGVLHATRALKLIAAPGFERHEGEYEFLFRLGIRYDFEVGRITIAPAFNVDFVDGEEILVYGVNIGRGF
jgi:hypothetical protein